MTRRSPPGQSGKNFLVKGKIRCKALKQQERLPTLSEVMSKVIISSLIFAINPVLVTWKQTG